MSTEQEYDAHADMLEDPDTTEDPGAGPGPYPQPLSQGQGYPIGQHAPLLQSHAAIQTGDRNMQGAYGVNGSLFDSLDPMLDADPFGLTASMHFPTQFSFNESSLRK